MTRSEFEKHFDRISESHKREDGDYTESGRPKIGKIGIGFIAANEICDIMEIISTKEGSKEKLEVQIRFDLMRQDYEIRKRGEDELAKADYTGSVSEEKIDKHYTQVFLKKVRGDAKNILAGAGSTHYTSGKKSLYGLKAESIEKILKESTLKTWSDFNAYSKTRLEVALNVPVPYHDNWIPSELRQNVKEFEKKASNLNFTVNFDGCELRKPIVFDPPGPNLIERFKFDGEHVSADGYFYAQNKVIKPEELQGVLLRIRNAAVGKYSDDFLGFSTSVGKIFQTWISGEIYADDRLEDAMNIDRSTLRVAHPAYVELQNAIHEQIAAFLKKIRSEIYGTGSESRKQKRAINEKSKIIEYATSEIAQISPSVSKKIQKSWESEKVESDSNDKILKKYSVSQLYKIVVEVAEEILDKEQFEEFLERLTDKLH
jgi:hypothetical protein